MKTYLKRAFAAFLTLPCLILSGCIADEPLNKECDILKAYLHVDNPDLFFTQLSDSVVTISAIQTDVVFKYRNKDFRDVVSNLAPVFQITEGATIEPANGSAHDFSQGPVSYTVTSQDGKWSRTYKVYVKPDTDLRVFDFESPYLIPSSKSFYYDWAEIDAEGDSLKIWGSGNPGFSLTNGSAPPEDFPTASTDDGYSPNGNPSKGVKLITRSTGTLGALFGMPIAAGNLFIGKFMLENALMDPLGSTCFGRPVAYKPVRLEGFYKYKMGSADDKVGTRPEDVADEASIYAVFFANRDDDGNEVLLDGSNVLDEDNERIIAWAVVPDLHETSEWTQFSVDFTYLRPDDLSDELLAQKGYSMTVVFSSSKYGAYFEGAVGSELCVDNVKIVSQDDINDDTDATN